MMTSSRDWHTSSGSGSPVLERSFGRKVGHVVEREDGYWVCLYDGIFLGLRPTRDGATLLVEARAEESAWPPV